MKSLRMSAVVLLLALVAQVVQAAPPAAADTVVVCPAEFREALRPWVEFRTGQGHVLAIVSNVGSTEQIRRRIAEVATGRTAAVRGPGGRCPARDRRQRRRRRDGGALRAGALRQGPGQRLLGLRAGDRHRPCVCRAGREDGHRAEARSWPSAGSRPLRPSSFARSWRKFWPTSGRAISGRGGGNSNVVAGAVGLGPHARFGDRIDHPPPAQPRASRPVTACR